MGAAYCIKPKQVQLNKKELVKALKIKYQAEIISSVTDPTRKLNKTHPYSTTANTTNQPESLLF